MAPPETARAASLAGDTARRVDAGSNDAQDGSTAGAATQHSGDRAGLREWGELHEDVVHAERAVLAAMMIDPACIADVLAMLQPSDFAMPRHVPIAHAIVNEHRAGGVPDVLTVSARLRAAGMIDDAGGIGYLSVDVLGSVATAAGVRRHAEIVREAAERRRIRDVAAEVARAAADGVPVDELQAMLESAAQRRDPAAGRGRSPAEVLRRWRDDGPLIHVPTGIVTLDGMTNGGPILGTRIYCNGAPNAGKTALAVQVADTWAQCGLVVGILGIDEEPDDLLQRLLQRRGWPRQATELRDPEELERMERQVAAIPIVFYTHEDTIETAGADLARRAKALGKHAALFVDSIQSAAEGDDRKAAVSAAAASARAVASRHRMIVWCTSEMNRAAYRSGPPPQVWPVVEASEAAAAQLGEVPRSRHGQHVPAAAVGGRMTADIAKCAGNGCPIREQCQRFVAPAVDGQRWVDAEWSPKNGCALWKPTKTTDAAHGGAIEEVDGA